MNSIHYEPAGNIQPAVFVHIQKTAGTSIVDLARHYYGDNMTSHGDHVGRSVDEFLNTGFVSGHFGYEFAAPLMRERYSFTFLRDPVDRILSFYYYCRSRSPDEFPMCRFAQEHNLEDFLKAGFSDLVVKTRIWNNQTWQLACGYANPEKKHLNAFEPEELLSLAKKHLDELSHVGFTQTFEQDRNTILSALKIPVPDKKVESNANKARKSVSDISQEAVRLLTDLTKLDQALYAYAWEKYHPGIFQRLLNKVKGAF